MRKHVFAAYGTEIVLLLVLIATSAMAGEVELEQIYQRAQQMGDHEEAFRQSMAFFDDTPQPLASSLLWGKRATEAAMAAGRTRELVRELSKRAQGQPPTALPKLILAQAYALLGDHPKTTLLLKEIEDLAALTDEELMELARLQETVGQWQEVLPTLRKAEHAGQSIAVQQRIAFWQLRYGDEKEALQIFTKQIADHQMEPKAAMGFLAVLCQRQQWGQASALMEPLVQTHTDDFQLRYLYGICLEESDREKEAMVAYDKVLQITIHLPDPAANPLLDAAIFLQPELREITHVANSLQSAYVYHRGDWSFSPDAEGTMQPTFVALTSSPTGTRAMALAHLLELARHGDGARRKEVLAIMHTAEVQNPELMLDVPMTQSGGFGLEEDSALEAASNAPHRHALWLSSFEWRQPTKENLPTLERCVTMFERDQVTLAFLAAFSAARVESEGQAERQRRALELLKRMIQESPTQCQTTLQLVNTTRAWPEAASWREAAIDLFTKVRNTLPPVEAFQSPSFVFGSRDQAVVTLWELLLASERYDDCVRLVEEESKHLLTPIRAMQPPQIIFVNGGGRSLIEAPAFPNYLVRWPFPVLHACRFADHDPYAIQVDPVEQRRHDAGLAKAAEKVGDPLLRLIFQRLGNPDQANMEMEKRLALSEASAADWLTAAWMVYEKNEKLGAERLAHVAAMPLDARARRRSDGMLLYAVLSLQDRPQPLLQAARQAALRLRDGPLTAQECYEIRNALTELGLQKEATELDDNPPTGNGGWGQGGWLIGSGFYSNQVPISQLVDELQKSGHKNEARQAALHYFQTMASRITDLNFTSLNVEGEAKTVLQLAGPPRELVGPVMPQANATPHELLTYAELCELTGLREDSLKYYQRGAEGLPWLATPHVRLTLLHLMSGHVDTALAEFNHVPAESQPAVLWSLRYVLQERNRDEVPDPEPRRNTLKFLTRWLSKATEDPHATAVSPYAILPLSEIVSERGASDEALLQACLQVREISQTALAILSKKTLESGGDFAELAKHAERMLEEGPAHTSVPVQRLYRREDADAFYLTPSLLLLWNAWQKNRPQDVEQVILPLAQKTLPPGEQHALRCAAKLFFAPPENFAKAAAEFCKEPARDAQFLVLGTNASSFIDGGPVDLVVSVMETRKLHVMLDDFFAGVLRGEAATYSSLNAITRYLKRASWMKPEDRLSFLRRVRDAACGTPEERAEGIRISVQQHYGTRSWRGGYRPVPADRWINWLDSMAEEPALFTSVLSVASEDGLAKNTEWLANWWGHAMRSDLTRDPARMLVILQASLMLEDAPQFRAWLIGQGQGTTTLVERVVDTVRSNMPGEVKNLLDLLAQRQPRTFGTDLVMLLLEVQPYSNEGTARVTRFIQEHHEAFQQIPADRRQEVLAALRNRLREIDQPERLDEATRMTLAPLLQAESDRLAALAEELMQTQDWRMAGISEDRFPELAQRIFYELSRKDEKRALAFATKVVDFVKELPSRQRRDEPPQGKTRTAAAYWLSRVSRTPHAYLLLQPLLAREGLSDRSSWQSDTLLNIGGDSLKNPALAPRFLEEMHFLDEAPSFRNDAFSSGWSMSSALSHAAQTLGYSPSRTAVLNYLKQRQPQSFGTALLSVLMEKDREKSQNALRVFVLAHGRDFSQLTPAAALGALAAMREVLPSVASPAQEPQMAPLLRPLLEQEEHWAMAQRDRLMAVPHWAELDMTLGDLTRETVDVLRALARSHPEEADKLFLHLLEIAEEGVRSEKPTDSKSYPSGGRSFMQWLQYCGSVPALVNRVLKTVGEQRGVPVPDDWLKLVTSQLTDSRRLADSTFTVALVEGLPFLKEAPEFRAYKIPEERNGTMLGELMDHLNHYGDARESGRVVLKMLLAKQPPTFGSELMLAMMRTDSKEAVAEFVKKRAADLSQLSAPAQEEMAILLSHEIKGFEKPESLDAELRAAAAPILAKQQALSDRRIADIMKAAAVADTHLSDAEFRDRTPLLLQYLADQDLPEARRFLTKVTELVRLSLPRHKGDGSFYTVANWLMRSAVAPQVFPEVMVEAQREGLLAPDQESDWFITYTQALTTHDNLKDGARILGFLEATSLLKDAPHFDPLSVVDRQYYFQTVMEMLAYGMRGVWADKKAAAMLREALTKHAPRTFGSDLVLAMVGDDPVADMAQFVKAHEAGWAQIAPEHRLAMAGLLRPVLSRMEAAQLTDTAEVERALQPILEAEAQHERDYLRRLMEAKTFEALGTKHYFFQRRLTWLLEWMLSTGEADPKAALAKACQLYKASAKEASNWDKRPGTSAMAYLLHGLANSPQLLQLVWNEAATWKLTDDEMFRSDVNASHDSLQQLWTGPTSVKAILHTSQLMEDPAHFEAFLFQNGGPRSQLEDLPLWLHGGYQEPMRPLVLAWLREQPKNFGTDLLIAALADDVSESMPAFMQSHAEDLAKLTETQRAAVERLEKRLVKQQEQRKKVKGQ